MGNTIFRKDEIIKGIYEGRQYRYCALKDGEQGSGSIYGPAYDELNDKKVFLKKYNDPAPRSSWFRPFVEYQKLIYERISASSEAQKMIASADFFQEERGRFWQVIEYVDNSQDMQKYLESSETTWAQRMIFASVFMYAMKILHKEVRLVHGDLKPENVLLTPDGGNFRIKLIDFDRPILLNGPEVPWLGEGYLGTPGYYSPEHLRHQCPGEKSDVFTCGLILYELLTKEGHPYGKDCDLSSYEAYKAPVPRLLGSFGSAKKDDKVAEMLHRMLEPDADNRPTAEEVHNCLVSHVVRPTHSPSHDPIPPKTPSSGNSQKLAADIVFLLDATGSMGPYINALREELHTFIHNLLLGDPQNGVIPVQDWRARVVGYRNFTACNCNDKVAWQYKRYGKGGWYLSNPFTRDEAELNRQLSNLKAFGGGEKDSRESLLDALMLVMKSGFLPRDASDYSNGEEACAWRANRVGKVIIVFTDAGFLEEMSYNPEQSHFEEREKFTCDLRGCSLDEIENAIEASHCKIFAYAPSEEEYMAFAELNAVTVWCNSGLVENVLDKDKFQTLLQSIVKGVSGSASEELELSL